MLQLKNSREALGCQLRTVSHRTSLLVTERRSRSRSISADLWWLRGEQVPFPRSLCLSPGGWLKGSLWDRCPSTGAGEVACASFLFICSRVPRMPKFMLCQLILGWLGVVMQIRSEMGRQGKAVWEFQVLAAVVVSAGCSRLLSYLGCC